MPAPASDVILVDLSDDELRRRGGIKWTLPDADVLAAWVAETDLAIAPVVTAALHEAVERGDLGSPRWTTPHRCPRPWPRTPSTPCAGRSTRPTSSSSAMSWPVC